MQKKGLRKIQKKVKRIIGRIKVIHLITSYTNFTHIATFNHQLERIQRKNEAEKLQKQKEIEEKKRKLNKRLKEKQRKTRLLSRKTKKGQPVMKNLLNYYINEKLAKSFGNE